MADAAIIQTKTLTDIADAIIAKGGAAGPLTPLEMPAAIDAISTGSIERKDANFYDSDGKLLFAFTAEEVAAMNELPTPPERELLTFTGWNHTLEQVKTAVSAGVFTEVGAIYATIDGATKVRLVLDGENNKTYAIRLYAPDSDLQIDWGDGSSDTCPRNSSEAQFISHEYSPVAYPASYTVSISGGGYYADNSDFLVSGSEPNVRAIYFGTGAGVYGAYPFYNHFRLEEIVLPEGMVFSENFVSNGKPLLTFCSLSHVNFPRSVTAVSLVNSVLYGESGSPFDHLYPTYTTPPGASVGFYLPIVNSAVTETSVRPSMAGKTALSIQSADSGTLVTLPAYAFRNVLNIEEVSVYPGAQVMGSHVFSGCSNLKKVKAPVTGSILVPTGATYTFHHALALTEVPKIQCEGQVPPYMFYFCASLSEITLCGSINTIGEQAFGFCQALQCIDMSSNSSVGVPVIADDAFAAIGLYVQNKKITVKVYHGFLDAYRANYADSTTPGSWYTAAQNGKVILEFVGV